MNWYKGNIADAVAHSKTKNAIFVVYVEGKDEATSKLDKFINEPRIKHKLESDDFVAIKIESETQAYMQFASIYQMVPVPSIFFIGKSGTPLDIATGVVNSIDELDTKITKVMELAGKMSSVTAASSMTNELINEESKASTSNKAEPKETPKVNELINEESKASTSNKAEPKETPKVNKKQENDEDCEMVCKDAVCFKKPKEFLQNEESRDIENSGTVAEITQDDGNSNEEETKIEETRKYLEQKRRERIEEENRLEKERELTRRKEGKDMQNLRAWQKDQEFKELKEIIKRERLEEQAARERIRAQIAADKAERAHKFAPEILPQRATTSQTAPAASPTDESRLQFRLATGTCKTNNFKGSTTLAEVRDYVTHELLPGTGIKEFTLATTYPKRELTNEHNSLSLIELELFPSAVILIIGKEASGPSAIIARNGGFINMFATLIMAVLNPVFGILKSARNWVTGQRAPRGNIGNNAQTGAQKRVNEEQNIQNDVSKRRNLDRFLSGNSGTGTTSTNNQDKDDTSPGSSQAGGAYRRYVGGSNIHRLSDNRKDSDDENATWNGNSTQQQ